MLKGGVQNVLRVSLTLPGQISEIIKTFHEQQPQILLNFKTNSCLNAF